MFRFRTLYNTYISKSQEIISPEYLPGTERERQIQGKLLFDYTLVEQVKAIDKLIIEEKTQDQIQKITISDTLRKL